MWITDDLHVCHEYNRLLSKKQQFGEDQSTATMMLPMRGVACEQWLARSHTDNVLMYLTPFKVAIFSENV